MKPEHIKWVEVSEPFEATMTFDSCVYHATTVGMRWKDENDLPWLMFLSSFLEDFKHGLLVGNMPIHGMWQVQKKGGNFAIRLVEKIY